MRDHSIFGETQSGLPVVNPPVEARTRKSTPWEGLFGTKLSPEVEDEPRPGIGLGRPRQGLS